MKYRPITSILLPALLAITFVSCKEANSKEPEVSTLNAENLEVDNKNLVEENTAEEKTAEEIAEKEFEELIAEEKKKRIGELELLKSFREMQHKTITDEYGLVQNYTIEKEYSLDINLGSTDEIRYTYYENDWKKWNSYKLTISLHDVIYNLKINGELKHQVRTFEQVYDVEHKYNWGTSVSYGTGANLIFEPDLESIDKRKEIYTEISRRFVFNRDDDSQSKWVQAYTDLIKNTGILDLNSYNDFNGFVFKNYTREFGYDFAKKNEKENEINLE